MVRVNFPEYTETAADRTFFIALRALFFAGALFCRAGAGNAAGPGSAAMNSHPAVSSGAYAAGVSTFSGVAGVAAKKTQPGPAGAGAADDTLYVDAAETQYVDAAFVAKYFYLSKTVGSTATAQCAAGYHMASIYELTMPGVMRYNTTLGYTTGDSGSGPPAGYYGWARNGLASGNLGDGTGNCNAYTTTSGSGTKYFMLVENIGVNLLVAMSPATGSCSLGVRVWCIQD